TSDGTGSMRLRGMYTIMEQASRIYSQNLLHLGLATLAVKFPHTTFHLLQPPQNTELPFGPSMGFEASRAALRFGYASTKLWLDEQGAALVRSMSESQAAEPPAEVAAALPARVGPVERPPDAVVDLLLLAGLLRLPGHRDLRDRVDGQREDRRHARLVLRQVEGLHHRHARLLHRGRGQGRKADDVAGRVDVPHRGLVGLVHRDQPALVDGQPRAVDAERAHVGDAAGRHQELIHHD